MQDAEVQTIRSDIRSHVDEIRLRLEDEGYAIPDTEYNSLLLHADRKRRMNGKEPEYLPLLMEDEIRQKCFMDAINAVSAGMLALA